MPSVLLFTFLCSSLTAGLVCIAFFHSFCNSDCSFLLTQRASTATAFTSASKNGVPGIFTSPGCFALSIYPCLAAERKADCPASSGQKTSGMIYTCYCCSSLIIPGCNKGNGWIHDPRHNSADQVSQVLLIRIKELTNMKRSSDTIQNFWSCSNVQSSQQSPWRSSGS